MSRDKNVRVYTGLLLRRTLGRVLKRSRGYVRGCYSSEEINTESESRNVGSPN